MKVKNNIVSFDFDGTIDDQFNDEGVNPHKKIVRDWILRLIRRGYDVHIITRRFGPDNSSRGIMDEHIKPLKVAKELGIPENKVIFTNREWKYKTIETLGACMHIDDDDREKYWIDRHLPHTHMVWLGANNWEEQIVDEIEYHDHLKIWISSERNLKKLGLVLFIILMSALLFL